MAGVTQDQIVRPDGRVELDPSVDAALDVSGLHNDDLAPVPIKNRVWTTYNYLALWVGMAHNVATWTLAAGLVALGMAWYQAIITIMLANIIVLIPMLANSHAGTKYGIPFPVFARASFGVVGANLPALIRAGVACGWFGIQTWIGGGAIFVLMGSILGDSWTKRHRFRSASASTPRSRSRCGCRSRSSGCSTSRSSCEAWTSIRHFENWAAPFVLVVAIFLLAWMASQAGGFGPIVNDAGKLGWGAEVLAGLLAVAHGHDRVLVDPVPEHA